jgi:hypothetical protein
MMHLLGKGLKMPVAEVVTIEVGAALAKEAGQGCNSR